MYIFKQLTSLKEEKMIYIKFCIHKNIDHFHYAK